MPTHLVISDCHVTVGQDLSRFNWLNRMIRDVKPDRIVCIGDFGSFDSLSAHHEKGDKTDMNLPQFSDELEAVREAQLRMCRHHDDVRNIRFTMIMGNHEDRWNRFISKHPKILNEPIEVQARYVNHWGTIVGYRDWITHDGIMYTHVPHTIMGKPIGGVNATRTIAAQSTSSVIFGHTHSMNVSNVPFIDGNGSRCAMSAPAFMNDGNVEEYAYGLPTGWTYGLLLVTPQGDKRPFSYEYVSMKDLENEYAV